MNKHKLFTFLFLSSFVVAVSFFISKNTKKSDEIVLNSSNSLVLRDEVNGMSVSKIMQRAEELNESLKEDEPIYLVLDTPGGSIISGLKLIDSLKSLGRPVHTITITSISMGFQIVQGLNNRYILPNGFMMSHKASGSMEGEFGGLPGSQLEKRFDFWNSLIRNMDLKTVERTNGKQTLESYQKAYENELWLHGQEAVSQGYADKVVNVRCDNSVLGTEPDTVNVLGFRVLVHFSKCPIISSVLSVEVQANNKNEPIPSELENKIIQETIYRYSFEGKLFRARTKQ